MRRYARCIYVRTVSSRHRSNDISASLSPPRDECEVDVRPEARPQTRRTRCLEKPPAQQDRHGLSATTAQGTRPNNAAGHGTHLIPRRALDDALPAHRHPRVRNHRRRYRCLPNSNMPRSSMLAIWPEYFDRQGWTAMRRRAEGATAQVPLGLRCAGISVHNLSRRAAGGGQDAPPDSFCKRASGRAPAHPAPRIVPVCCARWWSGQTIFRETVLHRTWHKQNSEPRSISEIHLDSVRSAVPPQDASTRRDTLSQYRRICFRLRAADRGIAPRAPPHSIRRIHAGVCLRDPTYL